MSKVFIEESTLSAIGDAIRGKTGTTELIAPLDMPSEIEGIVSGGSGGGGDLPEEALVITGNCYRRFAYGGWDWFIEEYGNRITTVDLEDTQYMFENNKTIKEIPFDFNYANLTDKYQSNTFNGASSLEKVGNINFAPSTGYYEGYFNGCYSLKEIGKIDSFQPRYMTSFFRDCRMLRNLPEFINFRANSLSSTNYSKSAYVFRSCYSLRSIPKDFIKVIKGSWTTSTSNSIQYYMCYECYSLDEIDGIPTSKDGINVSSNLFNKTFDNCARLKEVKFDIKDDGSVYTNNWTSQTIDLTVGVGWCQTTDHSKITGYNSGITADKLVTDDASYQALKNDPDWFTTNRDYARYNHDSAVNTINTLPDTSAYSGKNTIKFTGAQGSATDGGAINTLTEEEIAVAAAKGWTCSFV